MARKAKETKPAAAKEVKAKAPAKEKAPVKTKLTKAVDKAAKAVSTAVSTDFAQGAKYRKMEFKNIVTMLKNDVKAFTAEVKALKGAHGPKHVKLGERLVSEFDSFGLANDAAVQKLRSFITGLTSSK